MQSVSASLPNEGVLLEHLKKFEIHLHNKGVLSLKEDSFYNPVWFYAEMERNIYLWRNGLSVGDAEKFSFWVDPIKIVSKRLSQLQNDMDIFMNPLWGQQEGLHGKPDKEQIYLTTFLNIYKFAKAHLNALSAVSLLVEKLVSNGEKLKPVVLLPAFFTHH